MDLWLRRMAALLAGLASIGSLAACGSHSTSLVEPSTPVDSPAFRAYLEGSLTRSGVKPAEARKSVDCGIPKLLSHGIKTYGEFLNRRNAQVERDAGLQCRQVTRRHR